VGEACFISQEERGFLWFTGGEIHIQLDRFRKKDYVWTPEREKRGDKVLQGQTVAYRAEGRKKIFGNMGAKFIHQLGKKTSRKKKNGRGDYISGKGKGRRVQAPRGGKRRNSSLSVDGTLGLRKKDWESRLGEMEKKGEHELSLQSVQKEKRMAYHSPLQEKKRNQSMLRKN